MRRNDREITEFSEMTDVMKRCDVCRLALNDEEGYPYLLPLNFGMEETDGRVTLYFHGAKEGKKYDLIRKDARASFEMDCSHRLVLSEKEDGCQCTMEYESVIGQGTIEILSDAEKQKALNLPTGSRSQDGDILPESGAYDGEETFQKVVEDIIY